LKHNQKRLSAEGGVHCEKFITWCRDHLETRSGDHSL
jgi:hypothetical protein